MCRYCCCCCFFRFTTVLYTAASINYSPVFYTLNADSVTQLPQRHVVIDNWTFRKFSYFLHHFGASSLSVIKKPSTNSGPNLCLFLNAPMHRNNDRGKYGGRLRGRICKTSVPRSLPLCLSLLAPACAARICVQHLTLNRTDRFFPTVAFTPGTGRALSGKLIKLLQSKSRPCLHWETG